MPTCLHGNCSGPTAGPKLHFFSAWMVQKKINPTNSDQKLFYTSTLWPSILMFKCYDSEESEVESSPC